MVGVLARGMAGMAGRDVRMHVLLSEDHAKLGLKGDQVAVKRGYGRNVLIRQGRAVYATEENKQIQSAAQLRAQAHKDQQHQQQQQATSSASSSAATSASSTATATSAAPATAPSSITNLRYQLDLSHRLQGGKVPIFHRALVGRGGDSIAEPVTPTDLYRKLVRSFPSLLLSQITFTGGAQSVEKVGDFLADIALPGLAKPVQIKFRIQKRQAEGLGAAASAQLATPTSTEKPRAESIKA